jgi:hypothetical protein
MTSSALESDAMCIIAFHLCMPLRGGMAGAPEQTGVP